ncbi:type II secretion system protein F (GspF) [Georgenia satyanarayanai]|uniref:Type II secretion system protein F (GspF) n=1 Tax=Georgenia satyanarayanai TaxID=860221 RepID=A0A2Y9BWX1_9MICO|nr:type II secretion system F family protein [Georgenia satyanarayanai]PYG00441.1 type II secretion system protein F (GspF) [Georgenia satyanarayanai]SSA39822.1 type II secretion system protein F (GspF) [Georgenia satyanarayanai]
MGTVAGLLLGAGLLLLWFSCWPQPVRERRPSRWNERTQDLLVRAGAPAVTPARLATASVVLAIIVLLLAYGFTASPPIAVCFAVMAAGVPSVLVRSRARRRQVELRAVWPEVVDDLISAIRAGLSLPEALTSLGERGPEEVRPQFRRFGEDYRVTGRFTESLDRLKARLADPVADRIIEALRITREVGGSDLVRLLRTLAQLLREDLRTRGELEARQSWTVNGARLATAAPWAVLLLLSGRPETAAAFNSAAGVLVLATGAAVSGVAYWLMVRLGRLPEEARVLR